MLNSEFLEKKEMTETNKTVFVTGANGGIGLEVLRTFGNSGYNLVAQTRAPNPEVADTLSDLRRRNGVHANQVQCDLRDPKELRRQFIDGVKSFPTLDVLVNCAGVLYGGAFLMTPVEKIREIFDVNLFGLMSITQLVAKYMVRQRSGSIINVASVAGLDLSAGNCAYGVSKAAVCAFTQTLADELRCFGIRVNAVAPSLTDTKMAQDQVTHGDHQKLYSSTGYFARMARPEEIANVMLFLASDGASYINRQVVRVDGGNRF